MWDRIPQLITQQNFHSVTRAIDLLSERGASVLIAMTVTKENCHNIPQMVKEYGSRLTFQPFFNAGRGAGQQNKLALTGNEYYAALSAVPGVKPMGVIETSLANARGNGVFRCAMGESEISISQDGDVFPCQLLDNAKFNSGNIFETTLIEIYNNSESLTNVRKLNVNTISGCSNCPIRLICGAGCRARTFYEEGRLDISGEFCQYEQQVYLNGIFNSTVFKTAES